MEKQRANEIVNSPKMVNVTYNNENVYLERVNDASQTCTVHYLTDPRDKFDVAIVNLEEH